MKIYRITYDFDKGFELTADTVGAFYSDLQHFITISGNVIELKDIDFVPELHLYSIIDNLIFITTDEKKVCRYCNYFKKAIVNEIDVEMEQFDCLKKSKILNCTLMCSLMFKMPTTQLYEKIQ